MQADQRAHNLSISNLGWTYIGLVVFSLCGTILTKITGLKPGPIAPVASALTILTGFVAIFEPTLRMKDSAGKTTLLACLLLGGLIECIGIVTGFPFGSYTYTDKWVPTVLFDTFRFPVMLPFAWLLVVGAATVVCNKARLPLLGAAATATAVDLIMEPVMVGRLGYWKWTFPGPLPGGASALNPIGWLMTSWLIARLISLTPQENRITCAAVLTGHVVLTLGIGLLTVIPR